MLEREPAAEPTRKAEARALGVPVDSPLRAGARCRAMTALPQAPERLAQASSAPAPFGRVEIGRGPDGGEWIVCLWEGDALASARADGLFEKVVETYADFRHRALAPPMLSLDSRGRPRGLAYPILPPDSTGETSTLEQFAAYYDGTMLNVHVVDFIRKLADAVLAVHRHLKRMGAGERDGGHGLLLPAFLMVRADRSLRIAGLGLAKALYMTRPALVRQFAEVLGQSSFLAPESRSGAVPPATAMADLYSIGALTFFAACNADPEESRHALTELNLNVAPQMADIVRHCLRHDPKARFARLEEIVRALDMSVDPEGPRELPVNAPFARNEALLSADPKFSGEMAIADADPDADRGGPPLNRFIPLKFARADAPRQLAAIASLEPAMQLIQAGPSRQGSHGGAEDERPERAAYLDAFYMAQTAVTAEAFALFLTEKVRDDASEWLIEEPMALVVRRLLRKGYHALKGAERLPANCVSFAGAKAFCAWLAEKTGKPYRLPSEAEWERAARGPWRLSKRLYPWGDDNPTPLTSRFGRQWVNNPAETMAPVDGLAPSASPEGVLQMAGNVWEWCEDFYDRRAYALEGDPVIRPRGPEKGFKRVARGGAWMSGPKELRCASRRGETPRPDSAGGALGFRLAMSVPAVWSEEAPSGRALEEGKQG